MPVTGIDRMPGSGLARGTLFDKDLNTTNIVSSNLTATNSIILVKAAENSYTITWTQPSGADRILSIPAMSSADTFAFLAATQTFTNKTLTAPTISGGTVTAITDLDMTVGNKTILDTIGSNTLTIGAGGTTVVIAGNLTVSGATTTTVSNTLLVEDSLYVLNHGETGAPSEDSGFVVERGDDTNVGFIWDESADEFVVINTSSTGTETGNVTIASYANLQVATAQMSALNIGGTAVTTTAAEINLIDGGTARGTTAIADGDGVLINDSGTMRMTTVETLAAYLDDEITAMPNVTTLAGLTTIGAVANTLAMTFGDVTLYDDNNNADVSFKMGTSATESLTIQVLNGGSNKTAEEVHFSTATASGTGDHGKMVFDVDGSDILTIDDGGLVIKTTGTIGPVGDEDLLTLTASGSIVTVAGELSVTTLDIGGTNVTATATEINLIDGGTARGTDAVASGDGILINDGGTMKMTNVDTVSTYFASHNVGGGNIVTVGTIATGVWQGTAIASGYIAADAITGAKIDDDAIDSEHYADASIDFAHIQNVAANSILGRNANSSGVLSEVALATTQVLIGNGTGFTAAALSGDATMTNAGVVSLAAAQTNVTSIYATDLIIGEDAQTAIDFGTDDEIDFKINNTTELTLDASALYPTGDAGLDLGTSSLEFKDAFFDGTVTSDAFAGPITGDLTGTLQTAAQGNVTSLGTLTGLTVNGATVFNENSADVDFRIESNANTHMFFVDAGNNKIGINQDSPVVPLHVNGGGSGTNSSQHALVLESTTTGTAANNFGVGILFRAENANGDPEYIARLEANYESNVDGSEVSRFDFRTSNGSGSGATNDKILVLHKSNLYPDTDDEMDLGKSDKRFDDVYATNGTIQTSDMRDKTQIKPAELGLDFVESLKPVSYKWKDKVDEPTHYGLLAQEVIENLKENGIDSTQDFGGITGSDEGRYGARYTEFVPILIKAIQELTNTVNDLDEKIKILEEK